MSENEKRDQEQQPTVSRYYHEGMMEKMTRIIRWLILALVAVLVAGLLYAYATNQSWMKYVSQIQEGGTQTIAEEVNNAGVHEQPDQGTD